MSVNDASVAGQLVALLQQLGFVVIVRHPSSVEVLASSPRAEAIHLEVVAGRVRTATGRVGGQDLRVEILDVADAGRVDMTPRQTTVALMLAEGFRNDEIADRLGISRHTVRRHIEAVFRHLDVPNRAAATAAIRSGRIRSVDHADIPAAG